jgi:hypothetical protein
MARREKTENELIQDEYLWGLVLGVVLSVAAGGMLGHYCFGISGAIVGAILFVPVGFFVGWPVGIVLYNVLGVIAYLPQLIWVLALAAWRDHGPKIASFVASPNPVAAGSDLTLTASKFEWEVERVVFHIWINGTKRFLGYGTLTSPDTWTLNRTASFPPGSYTLHARARDHDGSSGPRARLTLTVE